jgi:hypothetical protein
MKVDVKKLFSLWQTEKTTTEISSELGITKSALYSVARRYALPRRTALVRRSPDRMTDPTPEELEAKAAEIRRGWSREEREKRMVGPGRRRWTIPQFAFNHDGVLVDR